MLVYIYPLVNLVFLLQLYLNLRAKDVGSTFKRFVSKKENLETLGGMSDASSEGQSLNPL